MKILTKKKKPISGGAYSTKSKLHSLKEKRATIKSVRSLKCKSAGLSDETFFERLTSKYKKWKERKKVKYKISGDVSNIFSSSSFFRSYRKMCFWVFLINPVLVFTPGIMYFLAMDATCGVVSRWRKIQRVQDEKEDEKKSDKKGPDKKFLEKSA